MTIIESIRDLWKKHPEGRNDLESILRSSLEKNVGLPPRAIELAIKHAFRELEDDAHENEV